jgi:hypothetical protein
VPDDLFYREQLLAIFATLRAMYEPRPTPWMGQSPDERAVTTEQWLSIITAAGITLGEFEEAVSAWVTSESGDKFPAPLDLLRLANMAKRASAAATSRPAITASRAMCDGSGWVRISDDAGVPCPRCNPALAAVFDNPDKLARWRTGTSLADLDVGVELRKGFLHYIVPLALEKPCGPAAEGYCTMVDGLNVARAAYADQCAEDHREPSWPHFDAVIATAVSRVPA